MNTPKFLHICIDEKFINSANDTFEKFFPSANDFYISLQNGKELRHVSPKKNIRTINQESYIDEVLDAVNNYDLVVLHGLNELQALVVNRLPDNVKTLWLFWGFELSENPYLCEQNNIIGELTYRAFYRQILIKKLLRPFYYFFKRKQDPYKEIAKAAKRIDYFGDVSYDHYEFCIQKGIFNAKFVRFSYYPIEFIFQGLIDIKITNSNILLGNSATLSNNHLEAFLLLSKIRIDSKKIITPLSYGDEFYAKQIVSKGRALLGDSFMPLLNFMPLQEYNKILQQCGIVIMNHYRAQAFGNIVASLWLGAKVFLNEQSLIYQYLTRVGAHIYSLDKDIIAKNAFDLLTEEQVFHNRYLLKQELGEERLVADLYLGLSDILKVE